MRQVTPSNSFTHDFAETYSEDDDYLRFLSSLADDDALPEEDDNDPDFLDDLEARLQEYSDKERWKNILLLNPTGMDAASIDINQDFTFLVLVIFINNCLGNGLVIESEFRMPEIPYDDRYDDLYPPYPPLDTSQPPHSDALMPPMSCNTLQPHLLLRESDFFLLDPCLSVSTVTAESTMPPTKVRRFGTPSQQFIDMFPKGTPPFSPPLPVTSKTELLNRHQSNRLTTENNKGDVMYINTLEGMVKMRTDAWTPDMIICLNRIINAHAQLLVQSFALCSGVSHVLDISEGMNGDLHSMYQLFLTQSDYDYGFETMLKTDVPVVMKQHKEAEEKLKAGTSKNARQRKRRQSSAARRKNKIAKTNVEAVIDLTGEESDTSNEGPMGLLTVLDVPALHVVPHLWQTLMVIHTIKRSYLPNLHSRPLQAASRMQGWLHSLELPQGIATAMKNLDWMMTCGISIDSRSDPISTRTTWSTGEEALLAYAMEIHGWSFNEIQERYFGMKDAKTVASKMRTCKYMFQDQWKTVEALLKVYPLRDFNFDVTDQGTDATMLMTSSDRDRILRTQGDLCYYCTHVREGLKMPTVHQSLGTQDAAVLNVLQEVIRSSTPDLVMQIFGNGAGSLGTQTGMQSLMCMLLGQIGGQLMGGFDTLFSLMSTIAGMQLMNGAANSLRDRLPVIEAPQQESDGREPCDAQGPPDSLPHFG